MFLSSPPVANTQRPASRGSSSGLGTNPLALRKKWSGGDSRGRAFSEERFPPPAPHPSRFWADGEGIPAKFRLGGRGNWQRGCCFFVDNTVDYCLWKSIFPAMIPPAPRSRRHGSGCPDCGTKRGRRCAASGPVPRRLPSEMGSPPALPEVMTRAGSGESAANASRSRWCSGV